MEVEGFVDFDGLLVKECVLFGEKVTFEQYREQFLSLSNEEKEKVVRGVLELYGYNSVQFYFVIQMLVVSVLNRVMYQSEDLFQDAVVYVLDKVRHYDWKKGKLVSFVYSLVMYKVVQGKYHGKKIGKRVFFLDDMAGQEEDGGKGAQEPVVVDVEGDGILDGGDVVEELILISQLLRSVREEARQIALMDVDSVYRRVYVWGKVFLEGERRWNA